jgi:hypothetical protein
MHQYLSWALARPPGRGAGRGPNSTIVGIAEEPANLNSRHHRLAGDRTIGRPTVITAADPVGPTTAGRTDPVFRLDSHPDQHPTRSARPAPPLRRPDAVAASSDANFIAALGVPVLDGRGCSGAGAHARDEHVSVDDIPDRVALVAGLLHRMAADEGTRKDG